MTDSETKFGMKAAVAAIAAAAVVGGVLYALYPTNFMPNSQNYGQGQTTTAGQDYTKSTSTTNQNATNPASQGNSSSKPPASSGSGY